MEGADGCPEFESGNLILNPGADAAAGSPDGSTVVAVPNWTGTGTFTSIAYQPTAGAYPAVTDLSNPPSPGANFFGGGPNAASSTGTQLLNVGAIFPAATIDAGGVPYELCGWFGGFASQDDNATLTATFENVNQSAIGTATVGPVLAADRSSVTGFGQRSTNGGLPAGTRYVVFTLTMTRLSGTANDGYADNLDFSVGLTPSSVVILGRERGR